MPQPSLLLVHGALTGAWVWDVWRSHLAALGWQVNVIDLRGHGRSLPIDLAAVTMEDYVADLASVAVQIERAQGVHPVVAGWSMGGLVAMMYAAQHPETPGLVLIEPSPLLETGGKTPIETVRRFAGEIVRPEQMGLYPDDPARSRRALFDLDEDELLDFLAKTKGAEESGLAFRQGLRGVSVPADALTCPTLVLYGDTETRPDIAVQNRALAAHFGGEGLSVPGAGHWGIVCHAEAVEAAAPDVDRWLRRSVGSPAEEESGNGA